MWNHTYWNDKSSPYNLRAVSKRKTGQTDAQSGTDPAELGKGGSVLKNRTRGMHVCMVDPHSYGQKI